jgi:hypothetical protein
MRRLAETQHLGDAADGVETSDGDASRQGACWSVIEVPCADRKAQEALDTGAGGALQIVRQQRQQIHLQQRQAGLLRRGVASWSSSHGVSVVSVPVCVCVSTYPHPLSPPSSSSQSKYCLPHPSLPLFVSISLSMCVCVCRSVDV